MPNKLFARFESKKGKAPMFKGKPSGKKKRKAK